MKFGVKTGLLGLPADENQRDLIILTHYQRVTNRQTDRQTDRHTHTHTELIAIMHCAMLAVTHKNDKMQQNGVTNVWLYCVPAGRACS